MAGYAYIENEEIKEIHYFIPVCWRNISNLDAMSEEELRNVNWYPIIDECPEYDQNLFDVTDDQIVYLDGVVKRVYTLTEKIIQPPQE